MNFDIEIGRIARMNLRRKTRDLLLWAWLALWLAPLVGADDWRGFRGDGAGVAESASPPLSFSKDKNIAWKVDLPGRGLSGPITVGKRVFLTSSGGYKDQRLYVASYDLDTGKKIWERQHDSTGRTMCHPKMCMATPTPTTDGERIYSFYSCNDLLCHDLDGNLIWARGLTADYKNASSSVGMSSSPVIVDGVVVVQVENDAESFAAGIDSKTGVNVWKIDRQRATLWATPVVFESKSGKKVLLHSRSAITAHEPKTGKEIWRVAQGGNAIVSTTLGVGRLFIPAEKGLASVDVEGGADGPKIFWQVRELSSSTPSPVVYQGRVYAVSGAGILTCADIETGKTAWKLRLNGPFSSSPIAAGGRIYVFNESGLCHVVTPSDKKGELTLADMGEPILCTPAFTGNAMLVRSDKSLWKIAGEGPAANK